MEDTTGVDQGGDRPTHNRRLPLTCGPSALLPIAPPLRAQLAWQLGSPLFGFLLKHYAPSDSYHVWKASRLPPPWVKKAVPGWMAGCNLVWKPSHLAAAARPLRTSSAPTPAASNPPSAAPRGAAGGQPAAGGRHADGSGGEEAHPDPPLEAGPLLAAGQWRCAFHSAASLAGWLEAAPRDCAALLLPCTAAARSPCREQPPCHSLLGNMRCACAARASVPIAHASALPFPIPQAPPPPPPS